MLKHQVRTVVVTVECVKYDECVVGEPLLLLYHKAWLASLVTTDIVKCSL